MQRLKGKKHHFKAKALEKERPGNKTERGIRGQFWTHPASSEFAVKGDF